MMAPLFSSFCQTYAPSAVRCGPMRAGTHGMSEVACVACMEAMTLSLAKRGISAASRICACSFRIRRSRAPGTSFCTRSKVSIVIRLARSPIAWMHVWNPALDAASVCA